jgi:hypothetical protein
VRDRQGKSLQKQRASADSATRAARLAIGRRWWPAVWVLLSLVASCDSRPNTRPDRVAYGASNFASDNDPSKGPKELLDENSGSTLIVVRRPIVLARSRTDVAANVRDYVTLVVAQEDRAGKYSTWLIVHRWSTVDPRIDTARILGSGSLLLVADGRTVALAPVEQPPTFASRGDLLYAPHTSVDTWVYRADLPMLRYVAAAHDLALRFVDDAFPAGYGLWEDGRPELQELLDNAVAPAKGAQ